MDLSRLYFFATALIIFGIVEFSIPYRKRFRSRKNRWMHNFLLIGIGNLLIKLVFPIGLIGVAHYFNRLNIGLFNIVDFSQIAEIAMGLIILDLGIYLQHVLFHKVNFFWRIHRVHHSDLDLDVTSALRFHPIEIILSVIYKGAIIITFGLSVETIMIFEIVLNIMAMFNHSNIRITKKLEALLRYIVVTPQMHIIHHSIEKKESDMNYGFNLSIWDRIFSTYQSRFISKGIIGNKYCNQKEGQNIISLLKQPFI